MIPKFARRGTDFRQAGDYYLRDKRGPTAERVGWTHTENLSATDPWEALDEMDDTYRNAETLKRQAHERNGNGKKYRRHGSECEKPVGPFSLSWHPEQRPDKDHMIWAMKDALAEIGLQEHQALFVCHIDEPQPHLHVIPNLVHPVTGKVAELKFSQEKLALWAEKYEREHGQKIYCQARVENNERRRQEKAQRKKDRANGQKRKANFPRHKDPALDLKPQITKLFFASRTGAAFQAGVEKMGFKLAEGDRILLIDRDGKMHSISRQIEGATAKEIRAKLADLVLPDVDTVRGKILETIEREKRQEKRQADEKRIFNIYTKVNRSRAWNKEKLSVIDAGNEETYGPQEREVRERLQKLEARQRKAGFFSKITGAYGRRQREIENDRKSLAVIEWRKEEARGNTARILEQRTQLAATLAAKINELQRQEAPAPSPAREQQPAQAAPPTGQERKAAKYQKKLAGYQRGRKPAQEEEKDMPVQQAAPEQARPAPPANDAAAHLRADFQKRMERRQQEREIDRQHGPEREL